MNKLLFIASLACVFSCSDEYNPEAAHQKSLCVTTRIFSTKSVTLTKQFSTGSTLGLYITKENTDELHKGNCKFKNVKALAVTEQNNTVKWELFPKVYLEDNESLKVYAYHPHLNDRNCLATHIPIQISSIASLTCDYMYGKHTRGHKPVNIRCPYVLLSMKHALSSITFQVRFDKDIAAPEKLNAIQISNKAGGNILYSKGALDIRTGNITYSNNSHNTSTVLMLDDIIKPGSKNRKVYEILVIPTPHPTSKRGEIEIFFTIGGKTYKYPVPEQTHWKKGQKYTYQFVFDGKDLLFEKQTCASWDLEFNNDFFIKQVT